MAALKKIFKKSFFSPFFLSGVFSIFLILNPSILHAHENTGQEKEESAARADEEEQKDQELSTPEDTAHKPIPAPPVKSTLKLPISEGITFRIEAGRSLWNLDVEGIKNNIEGAENNVGIHSSEVGPLLTDHVKDSIAAAAYLGYNIMGHVSLGVDVAASGWKLRDKNLRGGGGFISGTITWHPFELLTVLLKTDGLLTRTWDISFFMGTGIGALGHDRGLRGAQIVTGAHAQVYASSWVSIGGTIRRYALGFNEYVIDWDKEEVLEMPERGGGSVLIPTFTLTIRIPTSGN